MRKLFKYFRLESIPRAAPSFMLYACMPHIIILYTSTCVQSTVRAASKLASVNKSWAIVVGNKYNSMVGTICVPLNTDGI